LGFLLLLSFSVFLPVPSSLVMLINGAIFGVALGTILSIVGSTGAALLGYWLGASGAKIINRFIPQDEQEKAKYLFEEWGALAVIVTRPIPVLAETVSIISGISAMNLQRFVAAAVAGIIPPSILYAYTGAKAGNSVNSLLIFGLVVSIAGVFWLVGTIAKRKLRFDSQHQKC
jgi:uncharacterized membrane protein YdjX (TVP38/TMEM64 family)